MPRGVYKKTPEHREKIRQYMMGNQNALGCKHSPETRQKLRDRTIYSSPEYRANLSRALKGKRTRPADYRPSAETREKMRLAALRQPPVSAATKKKQSQAHYRSWQNPDCRRKYLASRQTPEYRQKKREQRLQHCLPTKMTSIECALYDQFKKRRLKFEMHKTMFGRFQPDFVFKDIHLIVQADGDYWHRILKPERDVRFNEMATKEGWTVWRFAESEILQHPVACGRAVARFVRSH